MDTRDLYGSILAAVAGVALTIILVLIVVVRRLGRSADRLELSAKRLERIARRQPTKDVRFLFDFGDPSPPELPEPAEPAVEVDPPPRSQREPRARTKSQPDE